MNSPYQYSYSMVSCYFPFSSYSQCLHFSLLPSIFSILNLHLGLQPSSVLLYTNKTIGACSHYLPTQFSTVEHLFPYSQCLHFSQLPVELKSPLSKFCALSLKLTILLLQLGIHLNLPIYIGKYHTDNHLYSTSVFTLIACASLCSRSISASFSCSWTSLASVSLPAACPN